MIDGYLLNMRVFNDVSDGKGQALKPLEEAAEVFGAWQKCDDMRYAATATREAFRGGPHRRMRGHRAGGGEHAGRSRRDTR